MVHVFTFFLKLLLAVLAFAFLTLTDSKGQQLKSIVYDFDGLDLNQTNLPEGDYRTNDLYYKIAADPLGNHAILGDRVLKLNLNWNIGRGSFGRGISRYVEFNANQDNFNFYFYNPASNNQKAIFEVWLTDDDNQNRTFESSSDDIWKKEFSIEGSSSWSLYSIPLKDFTDANSGGNGIFDMAFTDNKGMLLMVEFRFFKDASAVSNPVFYMDVVSFTDGSFPHGAGIFDLPVTSPGDYCLLGAYQPGKNGEQHLVPSKFESLFPDSPGKKIKYVNWFLQWAMDGTTVPKVLPGNEVQILLDSGYTPIITWEPMFQGYSRLDVVQPRLLDIINGEYDSYIDDFADKMKTYSDTVLIRFMHEFDGDWYSWSIVHNGEDPNRYISAFRRVVDRFRVRGANNVKWVWCVNSNYFPARHYNWIVLAYPGDAYVDFLSTDIYNNHYPTDLPWWKSFRWSTTESYYYLTKYFPQKPVIINEVGCRERLSSEDTSSQNKAEWYAEMDKQLQSNFHKVRGLVFFNAAHDNNWLVNSSPSALQSLTDNVWNDNYYFTQQAASAMSVNISSPANNSSFSTGANITISANVGGTGTVQKVEFYNGSNLLGADAISPYSYTWTNVSNGNYSIRAKAISATDTVVSNAVNIFVSAPSINQLLIPLNSNWKFYDKGNSPGSSWKTILFNDSSWKSGNAELGYGDGDETTVVSYGSSSSNKFISTYFRKRFTVTDLSQMSGLELSILRDDGAVVYLNGMEVYRTNMPAGTIYNNTRASSACDGSSEKKFFVSNINFSSLVQGDNVLSVEIHQYKASSSDISFNLKLKILSGLSPELIAANSQWKYLDNGSNQGTLWRNFSFNDSLWKSGNAELGYGDGGEATKIYYGTSSSNKYITTYFRKKFNVVDITKFSALELSVVRDDGIVVYINGSEVYRNNMPSTTIFYNTLAPSYVDGSQESAWQTKVLSTAYLNNGYNVIAVEIHQNSPSSSDISFNLKLNGIYSSGKTDEEPIALDAISENDSIYYSKGDLIIYPNPTTGLFTMEYCTDNLSEQDLLIEIYNPIGQVLFERKFPVVNECVEELIELEKNIMPGMYIMNLFTAGRKETKRIILTK